MRPIDGKPSLNDVVKTPNVDRLAREGVLFRNAFVNAPSCTPCRSSLVSGRYFFNCGRGAILNGAVWDSAIPTFPLLLKDAGYRSARATRSGAPARRPTRRSAGSNSPMRKQGRLPNNFSEEAMKLIDGGASVEQAKQKILDQVRGNFDDFLNDGKAGSAVAVLVRHHDDASRLDQGLRQKAVGHRARFARRQNAQVSARRARGPRRTWPIIWANARRSMPSWACCSSGWRKPASSNAR